MSGPPPPFPAPRGGGRVPGERAEAKEAAGLDPDEDYKREKLVEVGLVGQITSEQCVGCHNSDSPFVGEDFVFDFEARKDEGIHERFPLKYDH